MKILLGINVIGRMRFVTLWMASLLLLGACSSTPMAPHASMTAARDAIATAEQSDARQYAGSELDEAREELKKAERAVQTERMDDAKFYAQRSEISAELASARTETAKAEAVNKELARGAKALTEEMQRAGDRQ